jgi:glucosamine 6-phosphate synthetase-like amidotransferase/phosphosugar isomerase protein
MCGIFGFILRKPLSMTKVFQVLKKLETSQYPDETEPIGGYGAGVAVMLPDGSVVSEKAGKTSDSPAAQLERIMEGKLDNASVLLGHVRFPSQRFMGTVKFKEAAQPYVEHFEPELTIVSVHNGFVKNYLGLKGKLKTHVFESEKTMLIDSEVIPHYFGELLNEEENADEAVYSLWSSLEGNNAAALLHVDEENAFLHLIHKGKARGLTVWTNERNEVIFCSRPEPVQEELEKMLAAGKFKTKVAIDRREDAGLKLSFPANPK